MRSKVIILNVDLDRGAGRLLGRTSQLEVELSQTKRRNHMTKTERKESESSHTAGAHYESQWFPKQRGALGPPEVSMGPCEGGARIIITTLCSHSKIESLIRLLTPPQSLV